MDIKKSYYLIGYIRYLISLKRLSPRTAKCYRSDMEMFGTFLVGHLCGARSSVGLDNLIQSSSFGVNEPDVDALYLEVSHEEIENYIGFLKQQEYSNITIARKIAALRGFYRYLISNKVISRNPSLNLQLPRQKKKQPQVLTQEQIKALLNAPKYDTWIGARDRAILETLSSVGVRVSEVVELKISDVDFLAGMVQIRGEGKKQRKIPISSGTLQSIEHYFELRNKLSADNSNYDNDILFVNRYGGQLNARSIRRKIDHYVKAIGLGVSVSPHVLRHSFAVNMLNNGAEIEHVQKLLGHQCPSSTSIYKKITQQQMPEEVSSK